MITNDNYFSPIEPQSAAPTMMLEVQVPICHDSVVLLVLVSHKVLHPGWCWKSKSKCHDSAVLNVFYSKQAATVACIPLSTSSFFYSHPTFILFFKSSSHDNFISSSAAPLNLPSCNVLLETSSFAWALSVVSYCTIYGL